MWLDAGVYVMNGVGSVSFDVAGCRGVGMNTIEMLLILMWLDAGVYVTGCSGVCDGMQGCMWLDVGVLGWLGLECGWMQGCWDEWLWYGNVSDLAAGLDVTLGGGGGVGGQMYPTRKLLDMMWKLGRWWQMHQGSHCLLVICVNQRETCILDQRYKKCVQHNLELANIQLKIME